MLNPVVDSTIDRYRVKLKELALKIHNNPETGLEEFKACKWQCEMLKSMGFEVKTPFCGIKTAYIAKYGRGKPSFCFLAEYDALPEIGHACGHNLICTASIGAAKALAEAMKEEGIPGTVIVMGTPGEEAKGGKVTLVSRKAFKNIDAVLMAHPAHRTTTWRGFLAVTRLDVHFKGASSHASTAPEKGKNALDAVILFFNGINAWRQQLPESSRVHGIITNGGAAPNIIPDMTSCSFYLRSENSNLLGGMESRFRKIAEGAALMTDTTCEIAPGNEGYRDGLINETLNSEFFDVAGKLGMNPCIPERTGRASSDFGDVSHVVPGTHVYFGIAKEKIPLHSKEFIEASKSAYGLSAMLNASKALANVGYKFMSDAAFRKQTSAEFRNSRI